MLRTKPGPIRGGGGGGGGGGRRGQFAPGPQCKGGPQIWKIKKNNVERFLNNGLRKNFLNQNFADWSCFNQNLS
jgi:hypothetical protein